MSTLNERLDEIEKRCERATPGRWYTSGGYTVGTTALQDTGPVCVVYDGEYIENTNRDADAAFIAASRTDVPALTKALRVAVDLLEEYAEMEEASAKRQGKPNIPSCAREKLTEITKLMGGKNDRH